MGALVLGTTALAAALAFLGVNASVAAPDRSANPTDSESPSDQASSSSPTTLRTPLPEGVDNEALRNRMTHQKEAGAGAKPRVRADAPRIQEQEAPGARGENDTVDPDRLPGTLGRHERELQLRGTLATEQVRHQAIDPSSENDGAIPLARDLALDEQQKGVSTTGRVGDGPHGSEGSGSGDFDFYRFEASAGETLTVDLEPGGELFPNLLVYDAEGNLLIGAQDMIEGTGNAHLSYPIEQDGDYYVAVGSLFPGDPFDSASGNGVVTEGPYDLRVSVDVADTDVFPVFARKGEVLGVTVAGASRRVAVRSPDGELAQASALDSGLIYPAGSPLPGGGNATADHVVQRTGWHWVAVSDGSGAYTATVAAHRPPAAAKQPQTIFLDFSGPTFHNRIFAGSVVEPGERTLSPMRDFLPNWGLEKSDERAVIEATTERVREILREDIAGSKVRVTNSLEDPGLFGKPGVSRVMIGGTVEEAGLIPAFGIAQSIDPGNFVREETAIVMLDRMSAPGQQLPSLNAFLTEDSDRIRAVAQALGNTAGHEAGHYLGNWHTDDYDDGANLMDTGNLLQVYALGPDGVAGTRDDDRAAMSSSRYEPLQGLSGSENSRLRTGVALR